MSKSILFISAYEICYNPRLVKAADYLSEKGWKVHVISPVTGIASEEVLDNFLSKRDDWEVKKVDISKRTPISALRWLYVSLMHAYYKKRFPGLKEGKGNNFLMNKALYALSSSHVPAVDVVYVNLVNNLPYAAQLKAKGKAKSLVYDSQEYFKGQYGNSAGIEKEWVTRAEGRYLDQADVVCGTTQAMCNKLKEEYGIKEAIRLRNLPYTEFEGEKNEDYSMLKLIWHGLSVFYHSRGVNVLIEAVSHCSSVVELTLQGNVNNEQKRIIEEKTKELGIEGKVILKPAATPDKILQSLQGYHVGVIGEMPLEENQKLTSSNKLFDYIQTGLAVVASDMPGLVETIEEYGVGEIYPAGDAVALAAILDQLHADIGLLKKYREHSEKASPELIWSNDFQKVEQALL